MVEMDDLAAGKPFPLHLLLRNFAAAQYNADVSNERMHQITVRELPLTFKFDTLQTGNNFVLSTLLLGGAVLRLSSSTLMSDEVVHTLKTAAKKHSKNVNGIKKSVKRPDMLWVCLDMTANDLEQLLKDPAAAEEDVDKNMTPERRHTSKKSK